MDSLRPLCKARFTDVLDYGIRLYKKHFRRIFLLNLLFNLPVMVLLTLINPAFSEQYWSYFTPSINPASGSVLSSVLSLYTMMTGVLLLQGIYALTLKNIMDGSVVKIIYADIVLKQDRGLKQVVRECFRQLGPMVLGRFLYGLIQSAVIFVVYIVVIVVMLAGTFAFVGVTASTDIAPWAAVVLIALGLLVSIAVVFIVVTTVGFFFGRYWMYLPAICIEQQRAGSSIERCGSLGKNSFFLIGFTYVFGVLLVNLLPTAINTAFYMLSFFSESVNAEMIKIGAVIAQIFSSLMQPLLTCILTALYITQRVKLEGLDMEITLWSIKKEEADRTGRWVMEAPNGVK
jgi:hypothetical protein